MLSILLSKIMHPTIAASDLKLDSCPGGPVHYVPRHQPYPTELKTHKTEKPAMLHLS